MITTFKKRFGDNNKKALGYLVRHRKPGSSLQNWCREEIPFYTEDEGEKARKLAVALQATAAIQEKADLATKEIIKELVELENFLFDAYCPGAKEECKDFDYERSILTQDERSRLNYEGTKKDLDEKKK